MCADLATGAPPRLLPILAFSCLLAASAGAAEQRPLPTAALVVSSPLPPSAAALTVLHKKLSSGYRLIEDATLRKELEMLQREQDPEQLVTEALKDAMQRMRRLALEEVQRTLDEAEPYVQLLPPTPGGRSLLCAISVRRAHVALLRGDTTAAEMALQRGLSADPDFTLDQAQEPPTLVELFERVRSGIGEFHKTRIKVTTTPPEAIIVMGGVPLGIAPREVSVPQNAGMTIWAVKDGYLPRNVVAKTESTVDQRPLSIQIRLDPIPLTQQLRPILHSLRAATIPARSDAAHALLHFLHLDAVILAQLGADGLPILHVYGAAPHWPVTPLPPDLDLVLELPVVKPRIIPGWAWGLIGGGIGVLATGLILGTAK